VYAGFGTLEQLVEDLKQDGVHRVRVDHLYIPGVAEECGVRFDRFGVMVTARVDGEVRYAWLVIGVQQRLYDTVMSGQEVPGQTEAAYRQVVAWLQDQEFETRSGSYSFPADLRLMVAAAECLEREG
jgi:hypothetical protein